MQKLFKTTWCGGALSATALALSLQSGAVLAQETNAEGQQKAIVTGDDFQDAWQYEATIYGWLKSMDGVVDDQDLELDFQEDILDVLEGAFAARFEAEKGIVSLFAAYEYNKIGDEMEASGSIPVGGIPIEIPVNVEADVSDTQQRAELGAGYTLHRSDAWKWQVIGGAKWFDDELEIKRFKVRGPLGGQVPGLPTRVKHSNDFWQGFLGGRFTSRLSENWRMRGRLDYGYGGSNSDSWTAELSADWRFTHWGALQLGYRYMDIDYDKNDYQYDMKEFGPVVGFMVVW